MRGASSHEWLEIPLGDFTTLQRGFDITKAQQADGPYPVISSSGLKSRHADFMVRGPGVVIGRKGTLGTAFYIDEDYWPHDTTLWVKDFHGNDPRFAYYLLKSLGLERYDCGASNPTLNRNHIHGLPVIVPSVETQQHVASILSGYDDLIENNTRRIAILEEMARALYQEWFVHFRFPGHEHVPHVDSPLGLIPEAWEVLPFSSAARFVNGFAFKPSHWGVRGLPIVKIKELKNGITFDTPRFEGQLPPKYLIRNGDVLFSWSADLDAYIWSQGDAWLNQHLFLVHPRPGVSKLFLFYALRNRMDDFRARSAGTTMRHIKRAALDQVMLALPEAKLRGRFEQISQPMHDLIEILRAKNENLRTTRDLLLPKLISGEIDVSALAEEPIAEAAD